MPSPRWELPEIVSVLILVVVAILAVGGLTTGIARSVQSRGAPGFDRQLIGTSITFGAQWATYVVALALLSVVGLCWWHLSEWDADLLRISEGDDASEARGHIRRGRWIVVWSHVGLVVTAFGAAAGLAGTILFSFPGAGAAPDLSAGTSTVAVLVIAATGSMLARLTANRYRES